MRKAEVWESGLTLRGMTSLVTRKRSKWKSDTISRNDVEVHWDRYVDKLWKFCNTKGKTCLYVCSLHASKYPNLLCVNWLCLEIQLNIAEQAWKRDSNRGRGTDAGFTARGKNKPDVRRLRGRERDGPKRTERRSRSALK